MHSKMLLALWRAHEVIVKLDVKNECEKERKEIEQTIIEAENYEEPVYER